MRGYGVNQHLSKFRDTWKYQEGKQKVKSVIVSIQSHSTYGSSLTELNLSTDL